MKTLYPDQLQAKREIYHHWNNDVLRIVLGAPTGSGKTIIALSIIMDAISKGITPMFVVDRITLAHQTVREFEDHGLNVTLYQGNNTQVHPDQNVIVASVHTIKNRRIPECNLIIIDECHISHKHYRVILETYNAVKTLGMSATPHNPWLSEYFGKIVKSPSMGELIKIGRLVPFRVFSISEPDLKNISTVAGEYHQGQLSEMTSDPIHIAEIVDSWKKYGENRKTIAFTVTINEAKLMADDFNRAGIPAQHIDCHMDDDQVRNVFHSYESGPTMILVSVGKLTTGFDSPRTQCIIDDAPTKSIMRHIQKLGRGPRKCEEIGKTDVIVLDHTLNCVLLGHPALYEIPDLVQGEIVEKESKSKTYKCRACGYIGDEKFEICPRCGQEKMVPTDDYRKELGYDRVNADLEEMVIEGKTANRKATDEEKTIFFGGLKAYGRKNAYADGWASHKYKSKFGVWPNNFKNAPMVEPSAEVLGYIKHLNIKRAKSNITGDK